MSQGMSDEFKTITHAKCILAGEHAVFAGFSLIAKTIPYFKFDMEYSDNERKLALETLFSCSLSNENLQMYFFALLKKALAELNKNFSSLTGLFTINTNIPMAAGLGFSAALCVAVTDWLIWKGWLKAAKKFIFARKLEDLFHGKSSGADIATCMTNDIIVFSKPNSFSIIEPAWKPHLFIQTTDTVSFSAEAIKKVNLFRKKRKAEAYRCDQEMGQAVLLIISGLKQVPAIGIKQIAEAFNIAKKCFQVWDLIPPEVEESMLLLEHQGAIAVKPTGAGNGGSILSLWESPPKDPIARNLIAV